MTKPINIKSFRNIFILIIVLSSGLFFVSPVRAVSTYYFCDGTADHDPANVANYTTDAGCSVPAGGLPDFNVDIVNVVFGATFDGDAIFNGTAFNGGTVTGNATFYGDLSENFDGAFHTGVVNGTKTRHYTSDIVVSRNFVADGPWTIGADGAVVDVSRPEASYDSGTTFSEINDGLFIYNSVYSALINGDTLLLTFSRALNEVSIPDATDFTLTVNQIQTDISLVSISGRAVTLTLDSADYTSNDIIFLSYSLGATPLLTDTDKNVPDITNQRVYRLLTVGFNPYGLTAFRTKLYVANNINPGSTVSVIDTINDVVTGSISGILVQPYYISAFGNKVLTNSTAGGGVSFINTLDDSLITTVPTTSQSYGPLIVGNKLYAIPLADPMVDVFDLDTNSIIDTIDITINASGYGAIVGTKIYISGDSDTAVIDTTTDSLIGVIDTGNRTSIEGSFPVVAGTNIYINNNNDDTISVVDTVTDTVTDTIPVVSFPTSLSLYGQKVYVGGYEGISVIDTSTNTVVTTIDVDLIDDTSELFVYSTVVGNKIYFSNFTNGKVVVVDTQTDTVSDILPITTIGGVPFYPFLLGDKLYTSLASDTNNTISVIDTDIIPSLLPNLTSFTTNSPDGTYTQGQDIQITAHFGLYIEDGSEMTITLNNGAEVTLDDVSGKTISGIYTIGPNEETPDLAVSEITDADVTDTLGNERTEYDLPSSVGDPSVFEAENSFITRNLGDNTNITIGSYLAIPTGANPYQISPVVTVGGEDYLYVANQGDGTVSVIRLSDESVVDTIDVGEEAYGVVSVSISGITYVYIVNTGSDDVSVIDTSTNTVIATIPVGVKPYYATKVGTQVYITNAQSNTVSVIDANTNTVTDTIPVGLYPLGIKAHGTDVYVANYGDANYSGGNYVSVIDSNTNTVTDTIIMPIGVDGPRGMGVLGDYVYTANYRSNNITIIDATSNLVAGVVAVGDKPRGIIGLNGKLYVENFGEGTISVMDTDPHVVTDTIQVGHSPAGIAAVGNDLYFSRFQDNVISALDTTTNTLLAEFVPEEPPVDSHTSSGSSGGSSTAPTPPTTPPVPPVIPIPPLIPPLTPPILPITPSPVPTPSPINPIIPTAPTSPSPPSRPVDNGNNTVVKAIASFSNKASASISHFMKSVAEEVPRKATNVVSAVGVILPAIAIAITQPAVAVNVVSLPVRLWNLIPIWFGFRRKKRPWGTVYDSVTKQPLDPVYITLRNMNGQIVTTTITDIDGRFGFLVPPGRYLISARKDNYEFPSKKLSGKESDGLYNNLYFDGEIEISGEENLVIKNIPMDSTSFNWNEFEKSRNSGLMKFYSKRDLFLSSFANVAFYVGIASSIVLMFAVPAPFNYIIFGIYTVVMFLKAFGLSPKKPGYVVEKATGNPLSYSIIRVYSLALNQEVAHSIISKTGKYYTLVPNGNYKVVIEKKTGEDSYAKIFESEPIKVRNGFIGKYFKI